MEITQKDLQLLERATPGSAAIYRFSGDVFETLYVSPSLPGLSGMTMAEFLRSGAGNAAQSILPEDRPGVLAAVRDALAKDEPIDCYFRVHHQTHQFDWAHAVARHIGEMDGAPVFLAIYTNASVETDVYQRIEHREFKGPILTGAEGPVQEPGLWPRKSPGPGRPGGHPMIREGH